MKLLKNQNYIFCGDNLEWLNQIPDESIDLCYIDPPFFSNRNYEVIWGNGYELRSFGDRFAGGIGHYIEWMRPRVELIHQKLKKTGCIFLHCDWHASHRLRILLDDIFGEKNIKNEIIWSYGAKATPQKNMFPKKHDTIFYYTKSLSEYTFKPIIVNYADATLRERNTRYKHEDANGKYRLTTRRKTNGEKYRAKVYLNEGVPETDVWSMPILNATSSERLGYPTQKPEALIKRILECASNEGDVVLDCFGGGGTTAKACADMKRTFITGDVSPVSVKIMSERLLFDVPNINFEIKNLPLTESELKKMEGHLFAENVCEVMGWKVNEKKSGDGGIDGWTADGNPIQVKNHSTSAAGRPDLQKFFGALATEKKKKGVFVAWRFASEALEYIADMKREHKIEITAMECKNVFGGLLLDRSKGDEIEKLYLERRPKNWASNVAKAAAHKSNMDKIAKAKSKTVRRKKPDADVG